MSMIEGSFGSGKNAVAAIMAGGSGTRFWPLSRSSKPKQYLALSGSGVSLLEDTVRRVTPIVGATGVVIVTGDAQRSEVRRLLPETAIIAEPMARNTAPCLALAAEAVLRSVGDVPMLCLPADHVILHDERMEKLFREALDYVTQNDVLLTFGIRPTAAETGYGYIFAPDDRSGAAVRRVEKFVEKPDQQTAKAYLADGRYFWNSGMFAWRPRVMLEACARFLPQMHQRISAALEARDSDERVAVQDAFSAIDPVSIDVGVMERASNVVMVPANDVGWSDVGSWSSWAEVQRADQRLADTENLVDGEAIFVDSRGCAAYSRKRLIAGVGLENLIVVETEDAVLVCRRDKSQEVKQIVESLRKQGKTRLV